MFKRILVLVLFLFGVFWWLSNKNDDKAEPKPETEKVEVVTEENEPEDVEATDDENKEESVKDIEKEKSEDTEDTSEKTESTKTEVKTTIVETETTPPAPQVVTPPRKPIVQIPNIQTDVKVYMYEWDIDFSKKTIPSGTINFQVRNDGRFTHDFSIKGFGNLGKVGPGSQQTFTIKLRPGTYEVFSDRRQDYERGVKETIVVTK